MIKSKQFQIALGFLVSAGLIVWVLNGLDLALVADQIKNINLWIVIPCTVIWLLHMYFRSVRWKYLLPHDTESSARARFDGIMAGALATYILPLRAGEFVRPYVLSRHSDVKFFTGFVSVVIERFFDLAAVLISFGILIFFLPNMPSDAYKGAGALGILGVGMLVFMAAGAFFPEVILRMVRLCVGKVIPKLLPFAEKFTGDLLKGAVALRDPIALLKVIVWTIIVWLSNYLFFFVSLYFVPVEPTFLLATASAVVLALAVAAPSAPGFIGAYQVGCVVAFSMFSHSKELGIAYSIVSHLLQYIYVILYGIYAVTFGGLRFSELMHREPTDS